MYQKINAIIEVLKTSNEMPMGFKVYRKILLKTANTMLVDVLANQEDVVPQEGSPIAPAAKETYEFDGARPENFDPDTCQVYQGNGANVPQECSSCDCSEGTCSIPKVDRVLPEFNIQDTIDAIKEEIDES